MFSLFLVLSWRRVESGVLVRIGVATVLVHVPRWGVGLCHRNALRRICGR